MQTIVLKNGETYLGQLSRSREPHGRGRVTYLDGTTFEGAFGFCQAWGPGVVRDPHNNLLNGYHEQQYLNDGVYSGEYKNGQRSGFGIQRYVGGSSREGGFVGDILSGAVIYTTRDGRVFKEVWLNGQQTAKAEVASQRDIDQIQDRRQEAQMRRGNALHADGVQEQNNAVDNGAQQARQINGNIHPDDELRARIADLEAQVEQQRITIERLTGQQKCDAATQSEECDDLTGSANVVRCGCGAIYLSGHKLAEHQTSCNFFRKIPQINQQQFSDEDEVFECRCGICFFGTEGLQEHQRTCAVVMSRRRRLEWFVCRVGICGMRFESAEQLAAHEESHQQRGQ